MTDLALLNSYSLEMIMGLFCVGLIALAIIDLKTMILPDYLTIPLIIIGILYNHFSSTPIISTIESLLGATLGYCLIWLINWVYLSIMDRPGIGMGDAKLLAGIGALLGPSVIFPTLLIASLMGIVGGLIWLKIYRLKQSQAFPFGPYLSAAGITLITELKLKFGIVQYLAL